jgi:hypothetical protein
VNDSILKKPSPPPELTDRDLQLLLNSTHERAMRLLDLAGRMSRIGYTNSTGRAPNAKDRQGVMDGHYEHLALVKKLREIRKCLNA